MFRPVRTAFTIPYGAQYGAPREGGRHHQGTDYHCPVGTPIYATGEGRVVANVGETGVGIGFGNYVSIRYGANRQTLDGHLRERSSLSVGTNVTENTIVGYVGLTGNSIYADPPGSHDHHQVWIGGNLVDPQSLYGPTFAGDGGTLIPTAPSGVDPMSFSIVKDATSDLQWVVSLVSGNRAGIQSSYHKDLLTRVKAGDSSMLEAELNVVQGYLAAVNPPTAVTLPPLTLTHEQIQAIATAIVIPVPPHEFTITGKASA